MPSERARVATAAAVGLIAAVSVAFFVPWQLSVLVGWDVTVVTLLLRVWIGAARLDSAETARVATAEDNSRQATRLLLLTAAVASLIGVALAAIKAKTEPPGLDVLMTSVVVLTVVLSWALLHTLFALRYTRLYYSGEPGGIDFKNDAAPDFLDFAYVAFTVGMTFQVSDTDVQARSIRRAVLRHALLSYVFGVVIIAVTINVIAGFVK
ncbi:MAG TPA: DUF1345 domain-containing protein [Dermatophilaceae bacterium]